MKYGFRGECDMKQLLYSIFLLIVSLILCFSCIDALYAADEKLRIAILDLRADGVSGTMARTIGNMIRTELVNSGKFIVVERSQMDLILREQGFQSTGCTSQDCAVQVGRLLSARKMLMGEVSELQGSYYITVRIVDVELGEVEFAEKEVAAAGERLDSAIILLSDRLSARIAGAKVIAQKKEVKKPKSEKKPASVIRQGGAPEGLILSLGYFIPQAADFSDSYSYLIGGSIGYLLPINNTFALSSSAYLLSGNDESGDARASFVGASLGMRLGTPLASFLYPYVGIRAQGGLIYKQGKSDTASFMSYGADALAGLVFVFSSTFNIYGECAYSFGRVADESSADISGLLVYVGVILKL